MFVFLLLMVAELTHAGTENRNELFKLEVLQETILNQSFNGNQYSSELAAIEFEEDEQETQAIGFASFNGAEDSFNEGRGQLAGDRSHPAYPLSQVWLGRASDSSPPVA